MSFGPWWGIVGVSTGSTDSWARLAALSDQLRTLEAGRPLDPASAPSSAAVRARLAARAIDTRIAERRAREHAEGRVALEERMRRFVSDALARRTNTPVDFGAERAAGVEVFWSPTPIPAYRAWAVGERIQGVVGAWMEPFYRAGCWTSGGERLDPAVPHTDGSCGHPPCGIYALKAPARLIAEWRPTEPDEVAAFGLVALSGKVVEHEAGYRASHVRVLALVLAWVGRILTVEDPGLLAGLFADPQAAIAHLEADRPDAFEGCSGDDQAPRITAHLQHAAARHLGDHGDA